MQCADLPLEPAKLRCPSDVPPDVPHVSPRCPSDALQMPRDARQMSLANTPLAVFDQASVFNYTTPCGNFYLVIFLASSAACGAITSFWRRKAPSLRGPMATSMGIGRLIGSGYITTNGMKSDSATLYCINGGDLMFGIGTVDEGGHVSSSSIFQLKHIFVTLTKWGMVASRSVSKL